MPVENHLLHEPIQIAFRRLAAVHASGFVGDGDVSTVRGDGNQEPPIVREPDE
jgi:hypothetical protein